MIFIIAWMYQRGHLLTSPLVPLASACINFILGINREPFLVIIFSWAVTYAIIIFLLTVEQFQGVAGSIW